jgi:hypothetical protein
MSFQKEPLRDDTCNTSNINAIKNNNTDEEIFSDNTNSERRWFPSIQRRHNHNNNNKTSNTSATLFCGFCDMRIAAVLLNMVHVIYSTLLEVMELTHSFQVSEPPFLWILAIIFSGWGVFGAIYFHLTSIFASTLGLICLLVLYLSEEHLLGMILVVMIVYCHVIYICEMQRGIMTKEQYARHQYMDEVGQDAMQKAQAYASDVGETTKVVALDITRTASHVWSTKSSPVGAAADGGTLADDGILSKGEEVC